MSRINKKINDYAKSCISSYDYDIKRSLELERKRVAKELKIEYLKKSKLVLDIYNDFHRLTRKVTKKELLDIEKVFSNKKEFVYKSKYLVFYLDKSIDQDLLSIYDIDIYPAVLEYIDRCNDEVWADIYSAGMYTFLKYSDVKDSLYLAKISDLKKFFNKYNWTTGEYPETGITHILHIILDEI